MNYNFNELRMRDDHREARLLSPMCTENKYGILVRWSARSSM
jgi:hypothetical protein